MSGSMTIDEVKKEKIKLEATVTKLLKDFEDSTELKLSYIDIKRKQKKPTKTKRSYDEPVDGPYSGPITDVKIEAELDLVY